jgi:hypothetical protein
MAAQNQLEAKMDEMLVKNAPFQIPENGRKAIVEWAPWLALFGAILSLLASYGLWHAAHAVSSIANTYNDFARAYGVDTSLNHFDYGPLFYLSFAVLIGQGLLMLYAYPGLKVRSKKRGWDILLLSVVANFVYNVVYAFTDSGSMMNLIWAVIGAVIGLYFLAQIRSYYNGAHHKVAHPAHHTTHKK